MEDLTASGEKDLDEAYWKSLLEEAGQATSLGEEVVEEAETLQEMDEEAWRAAEESLSKGEILELQVKGCNRGGLLVDWKGIMGFVPVSHLDGLPSGLKEEELREELALRVGQLLRLKIIEVEPGRGRLVFSQRALGWTEDPQGLLESLIPGEVRRGQVTRLCDFGAFVDLGGFDGLLHISELSWRHVEHPGEVLDVGQEMEIYILDVDRERKRVALSLKRLEPDPWSLAAEKYEVDQIVEGTVTNVVDFGAFVRVEEGLEGLIHISELAEGNFLHPRNVIQEGDVVKARILNIDPARRRMGLSLRQV